MILAAELALIAVDPETGHHPLGARSCLNACLAGLLIAESSLDDRPESVLLAAAAEVVADAGPNPKGALSAMNGGLKRRVGLGTWDAVVDGLVAQRTLTAPEGKVRPRHEVLDLAARERTLVRLRRAATSDDPLDPRTALLLSMTGPARLLELVAPDRPLRRHARHRIDHALDGTAMQPVGQAVRQVIAESAG